METLFALQTFLVPSQKEVFVHLALLPPLSISYTAVIQQWFNKQKMLLNFKPLSQSHQVNPIKTISNSFNSNPSRYQAIIRYKINSIKINISQPTTRTRVVLTSTSRSPRVFKVKRVTLQQDKNFSVQKQKPSRKLCYPTKLQMYSRDSSKSQRGSIISRAEVLMRSIGRGTTTI